MAPDSRQLLLRFKQGLALLQNLSVQVSDRIENPPETAVLAFADGSTLRAAFWRLTKDGKPAISSFDHLQQYGLPAPLDALQQLRAGIQAGHVLEVRLDQSSGDLIFTFSNNAFLQVFNFTGYEVWQMTFANGTGDYSNYIQSYLRAAKPSDEPGV
jgi:hypothetical protein